jgi:hypothetical protein
MNKFDIYKRAFFAALQGSATSVMMESAMTNVPAADVATKLAICANDIAVNAIAALTVAETTLLTEQAGGKQ